MVGVIFFDRLRYLEFSIISSYFMTLIYHKINFLLIIKFRPYINFCGPQNFYLKHLSKVQIICPIVVGYSKTASFDYY